MGKWKGEGAGEERDGMVVVMYRKMRGAARRWTRD